MNVLEKLRQTVGELSASPGKAASWELAGRLLRRLLSRPPIRPA